LCFFLVVLKAKIKKGKRKVHKRGREKDKPSMIIEKKKKKEEKRMLSTTPVTKEDQPYEKKRER